MSNFKIKFGSKKSKGLFEKQPVKIKYSEPPNIEKDAEIELNELQAAFRDKAKAEKELKEKNVDGVFWSCVVFKTQEQRDRFLELLSLTGSDEQMLFVNGQKLIKALELKIDQIEMKTPGKFRCNKEIADLAMKL